MKMSSVERAEYHELQPPGKGVRLSRHFLGPRDIVRRRERGVAHIADRLVREVPPEELGSERNIDGDCGQLKRNTTEHDIPALVLCMSVGDAATGKRVIYLRRVAIVRSCL
jgi:hypothetical protein